MSYEHDVENIEYDVLTVAVQGCGNRYFLWQKGLTEEVGSSDGIYFEYDDQINSGYNNVKECTVSHDGIKVVLINDKLVHCHFVNGFDKFSELKSGLTKIYQGSEHVLEFCL